MEILPATTGRYIAGALVLATLALIFFMPTNLVRWLQKKNYQYEVTTSLYMLTPTEKFVFNSVLFLTFSMFTLATVLYLPDHISTMSQRAFYYFAGDSALGDVSKHAASELGGTASKASDAVLGTATDVARTAYEAVANATAAAAQQGAESAG